MSKLYVDEIHAKTSGGNKGFVTQVVSETKTDTQSITGAYVDVLSATITPSNANSKILIQVTVNGSANERYSGIKLFRGSTQIALGDTTGSVSRVFMSIDSNQDEANSPYLLRTMSGSFLDTPSTSSSVTYKIQAGNDHSGSTVTHINKMPNNDTLNFSLRGITTLTLTEISG
jgi:hypothetical protein